MGLLSTIGTIAGNAVAPGWGGAIGGLLGNSLDGGGGTGAQGALQTAGGLMQTQMSSEAAKAAAQRALAAGQQSSGLAQFRPVGLTTRYGSSNFQYDPTTGQMVSAGYTGSPTVTDAQAQLEQAMQGNLAGITNAQQMFSPLQAGSQNLYSLANQYLDQSPTDVANNWYTQQQNLLAPTREQQLGQLNQNMYNTGTTGLKVGSTNVGYGGAGSAGLQGTNPLAQALANTWGQQDASLAAQAPQVAQQQIGFGAGLLGQGATAMNNYYGGLSNAYSPYTTGLNTLGTLESMAQQPLNLSSNLGNLSSTAGARAGQLYGAGVSEQNKYLTGQAATTNPYAALLSGASGSTGWNNLNLGSLFGNNAPSWTTGSDVIPTSTFNGSGDASWMSSPWM